MMVRRKIIKYQNLLDIYIKIKSTQYIQQKSNKSKIWLLG